MRPDRRKFVLGLAAMGGGAALGLPRTAWAASGRVPRQALHGTMFNLDLVPTAVNITGNPRTAMLINGSLPGPMLHWREGDTVTMRVTNRLPVSSSVHWHGVIVPTDMDGVPGHQLSRHRAGRDIHLSLPGAAKRHLLVPQSYPLPGTELPHRRARDQPARTRPRRRGPRLCDSAQ